MAERNFKGVWIPKEIWFLTDISFIEKGFLVEIDSLDNENGCFAGNKHFADFFQLSEDRCSQIISNLQTKGYIKVDVDKSSGKSRRNIKMVFNTTRRKLRVGIREPLGEKAEWPLGENYAPSNTIVNNTINIHGENSVSQKKEKESFEEYMSGLGYEPYELEQNDYMYQTYRHEDGSVLSAGKLKQYESQYTQKTKKQVGIDSIAREIKPKTGEQQIIQLFSYNPAHVTWFKNKTQKEAIKELLVKMTVPQIAVVLERAKQARVESKYAPRIDTPQELLTKMVKLKDYIEKPGGLGVV